ncbi:MAG TPA: DPP IV N-terminal domain-containing protein [Phycisphaerales bacterium]|nr:DPP IV N-terminal domain-containing protein [Phycisphaerales bacterium]HMP38626.1 DPP IV N-terminal domain-containing protein [Phycisphaerales bacterium]
MLPSLRKNALSRAWFVDAALVRRLAMPPALGCAMALAAAPSAAAQHRLEELPGHERHRLVSENVARLAAGGRLDAVRFADDGRSLHFRIGDRVMRWSLDADDVVEVSAEGIVFPPPERRRRGGPARGRQAAQVRSPDGAWDALCIDHDVVVQPVAGGEPVPITTGGTAKFGYGRASWVYGEELDQDSAMWWSPDSTRLAFYEFDDRAVPEYVLPTGWTGLRPSGAVEHYPKAGDPNPIARLLVHDLRSGQTTRIDVGPETDQYVYAVEWAPDGSELLFHRTNRRQDTLELLAADPATGATRVVLVERQPTYQKNRPEMRFLADGRRFVWESERSGWARYELRGLDGSLIAELTGGAWPALGIVEIDEGSGWLYYTAASGSNPLSAHLHRARLDGSDDQKLTDGPLHHSRFRIAPGHERFVACREAADTPPTTVLYAMDGTVEAILAESDTARLRELGLSLPELFSFVAADGETPLFGVLYRPSHFDASRAWPLVVDVYGGPGVRSVRNTWVGARPECELGFLVAQLENRGTPDRGKAFESATYLRLGVVDLDDQAAGVRALIERPEVDGSRVGITGASYGGYLAALALLRHPDLFHAAVAVAAVTDWRHYDTIYTERFMRTPAENLAGYDAGSCVRLAGNLIGKLLIMHGMLDDNVHPNNAWQLVHELQRANIPFQMMFFPEADHGVGGRAARSARWGYLWEQLVAPGSAPATRGRPEVAEIAVPIER